MKEIKDASITFRVDKEFKEKILEFCKKNRITLSEFLRQAAEERMGR